MIAKIAQEIIVSKIELEQNWSREQVLEDRENRLRSSIGVTISNTIPIEIIKNKSHLVISSKFVMISDDVFKKLIGFVDPFHKEDLKKLLKEKDRVYGLLR